jgi:hypothetical protein
MKKTGLSVKQIGYGIYFVVIGSLKAERSSGILFGICLVSLVLFRGFGKVMG